MSLQKKKSKLSFNLNPPKIGTEYLKYGMDRIEELMRATDVKTKYLPKTIRLEDLDWALFEYINSERLKLVVDGEIVPTFWLDNDRYGELIKTWKFVDEDKNVPTPYITVRRVNKEKGTRLGSRFNVPQQKLFRYVNVPILDNGEKIYLLFKMPEPINVDITYEMSLFTKYRVDINQLDEIMLKNFSSIQEYVYVNGSSMPLKLEGIEEANTIENIDGDRFFASKYNIKLFGFIQNEKDFQIVKSARTPQFGYVIT